MGGQVEIFGYKGDDYFDRLPAYSAQNSSFIAKLVKLQPDSTVIDVGANIGVTTIIASRCVPKGRVIAVEPAPRAFQCLTATVSANRLHNCHCVNKGLGTAPGSLPFVESEFLAGSYVGADSRESATTSVAITTLDDLVHQFRPPGVDLIKIDVEGFELDVLQGSLQTIRDYNPLFIMEFNSFALIANRNQSPRALLDFVLDKFGYFTADRGGEVLRVSTPKEVRDFLYSNMVVHGCIDDISFGGRST